MIVEISGGKGGLKEYLEHGKKKGRDLHRDQLDQRVALAGDLNVFEMATSVYGGNGDRYDHITCLFQSGTSPTRCFKLRCPSFGIMPWRHGRRQSDIGSRFMPKRTVQGY